MNSPTTGIAVSKDDRMRLIRSRSLGGSPRSPSAADAANVSKPSGIISRISLTMSRDYAPPVAHTRPLSRHSFGSW